MVSQVFPPEAAGQVYLLNLPSRKQLDVASSSGLYTTSTSCGPEQFINLLQASSLRWQPALRLMGTLLWISMNTFMHHLATSTGLDEGVR